MQNSSNLITSIYKSRKTILEQLKSLGYNTDDYDNFSIAEINLKYENKQLDMLLEKTSENPETGKKHKVYVLYYLAKLIRPNNIQEFIDDLYTIDNVLTPEDTLMIIAKEEVNDTLMSNLKHIWENEKLFIVIQSIKRLQFNIQKHIMVPPHRLLPSSELAAVKERYNIERNTQFPDISRFDPVALSICLRPGEVCEIIRSSKSAISTKYYRICV